MWKISRLKHWMIMTSAFLISSYLGILWKISVLTINIIVYTWDYISHPVAAGCLNYKNNTTLFLLFFDIITHYYCRFFLYFYYNLLGLLLQNKALLMARPIGGFHSNILLVSGPLKEPIRRLLFERIVHHQQLTDFLLDLVQHQPIRRLLLCFSLAFEIKSQSESRSDWRTNNCQCKTNKFS